MPGPNIAAGVILSVVLAVSSCGDKRSRIEPLAPDLERWIVERGSASCKSLQGRFRIAAGVQASLKTEKYRQALLHELSGPGRPPMPMDAAVSLSSRSAEALEAEIDRRCPDQQVKHREDIVYVPQQF
jgi:hypothetical protein